ncbi:peptidoglycan synthase [Candidatus Photodesmus katoptron]|uniref:Peptidoglycan D,D-transpeptidase FtsI n=1 Tax=Candidatus Photodesmus katoptron Akat1 TaxID=1236703 RepID=S3EHR8_9GAMM|nr:penicillin binding protein transpeptidase [Candidatus Photodesmus katoptron Akat1]KEY90550.1 peptidoglycan synthase [Candidatus Photodesmus katoptron]
MISWRFRLIFLCILWIFIILVGRIGYIQILEPDQLIYQGDMRSVRAKTLHFARGIISDRNGEPLAISVPVEAVWADPIAIFKGNALEDLKRWYALADVLKLRREELIKKIEENHDRRFIYIQRQVTPVIANYIRKLNLVGIGLKSESRRYYPTGEVSAHVIGVVGIDGYGLEGIEYSYNKWLTGEVGRRVIRKDHYGRVIENISLEEREEGKPLKLTIDQRLQAIAFRAIKQAVSDFRATSGSAVLLDIKTGEVLAMVNAPSYNPNNRSDLQSFKMRNRVITDSFEPGSTVKPFAMLAALKNGAVNKDTVIDTGSGVMRIGKSYVRDTLKVGKADLTTILKKSSNIGIAMLALNIPLEVLLNIYSSVGFGEVSGLNLSGETAGIFHKNLHRTQFEIATLAFGYGLSITPLQLAHAYATLGNYGKYQPVHIIKSSKLRDSRQVIDGDIAKQVLLMLEEVTHSGGTARKAAVPGYRVAAKTGTSRKAIPGGYGDEYFAYTAGVAPVSEPKVALVVIVNEPQGDHYYGGIVASPVFSEIMQGALQILNIPPDNNKFQHQ